LPDGKSDLLAFGESLQQVLVEKVLKNLCEVIRFVKSEAFIEISLVEDFDDELFMREELIELRCLHFLHVL